MLRMVRAANGTLGFGEVVLFQRAISRAPPLILLCAWQRAKDRGA